MKLFVDSDSSSRIGTAPSLVGNSNCQSCLDEQSNIHVLCAQDSTMYVIKHNVCNTYHIVANPPPPLGCALALAKGGGGVCHEGVGIKYNVLYHIHFAIVCTKYKYV